MIFPPLLPYTTTHGTHAMLALGLLIPIITCAVAGTTMLFLTTSHPRPLHQPIWVAIHCGFRERFLDYRWWLMNEDSPGCLPVFPDLIRFGRVTWIPLIIYSGCLADLDKLGMRPASRVVEDGLVRWGD
jgi:hypothetical protein